MGGSRSFPVYLAVLAAPLLVGCRLAPAKVQNLNEVHHPDGSPRQRGDIRSDFMYMLGEAGRRTNFGGQQEEFESDDRIEDPLGTCLENLIELGKCERDEGVVGMQAATYGWLAVDCTYALSRERCVLELGDLAGELGLVLGAGVEPEEPATPEEVIAAFEELVETVREIVAAPELAGRSLEEICAQIIALPLERQGALRLLRSTNSLLRSGIDDETFSPLRELRIEMARRCTALALRAALQDPSGRVRAAALQASVRAFPAERALLLRQAMIDPMENVRDRSEVSRAALELLARYGLPPAPPGQDPEAYERSWRALLVQILRLQIDGPHTVQACRALAKITGEEPTLRSEVWLARARAADAEGVQP